VETAKGVGTAVAQHTGRRVNEDGIKTEQPKEDQRWDRQWHVNAGSSASSTNTADNSTDWTSHSGGNLFFPSFLCPGLENG
jgi:hypothetical protein